MKYNVGTDIVNIKKLEKTINNNHNFIHKIYTPKEIEYAKTLKNPINYYATRFAAKEAILKATNIKYEFNEIEILKNNDGKPIAHIINHKNIKIDISLSYDEEYAIAFCIVS